MMLLIWFVLWIAKGKPKLVVNGWAIALFLALLADLIG